MTAGLLSAILAGRVAADTLAPRAWEQLLAEARKSMLIARLGHQASEQGWYERIPPRPERHLEAARRDCAWQLDGVRWEVGCIEHALAGVGTPIVLLKGAAYVMAGLPVGAGRFFSDIDIMVRRDRLLEVEQTLVAHGWYSNTASAYDQKYYRQWMHEIPPLQHVRRLTVIDVHHTIAPPTSKTPVDAEKLFAAARPVAGLRNFFVLAPADMLLHSAVHLMQEGEFEHGLRDVVDLDALFRDFGRDAGFWRALIDRTAEHGLGRPLYYAVQQTRRLLDTPMPEAFLRAVDDFAPGVVVRGLMGALLEAALTVGSAREVGARVAVSRSLLYLRGHYLRMPLWLLIPHLLRKASHRLGALGRGAESLPMGGQRTGAN